MQLENAQPLRAAVPLAPPLPTRHPLGHLAAIKSDPVGLLLRAMNELGDVARLRIATLQFTAVFHPRDVQRVLVDNAGAYSKRSPGYEKLRLLLGNGLVTSEGSFWLRQRRISQPAFKRQRIAGFADSMVTAATDLVERWGPRARRREVFDIHHEMMRVTMRIAGETLLSYDPSRDADEVGHALTLGLRYFDEALHSLVPFYERVPLPRNLRARRAIESLDRIVLDLIAKRRESDDKAPDLLTMLMEARDEETGEGMTDDQLRDEVMTMFLAGHETTANALTWTLALLSLHPDARRRAEEEVDRVLGGRAPTLDDIKELSYLGQVLKESMRLYPPVWIMGRRAEEEDELGGYRVAAGSYVLVSQYVTHRHPDLWDNPEGFDPGRFDPERSVGRPRYAYFPFSGGPRQCIGNHMAEMEAVLVLATLLSRARFSLVPGARLDMEPSVTLRPAHGLPMSVELRAH